MVYHITRATQVALYCQNYAECALALRAGPPLPMSDIRDGRFQDRKCFVHTLPNSPSVAYPLFSPSLAQWLAQSDAIRYPIISSQKTV